MVDRIISKRYRERIVLYVAHILRVPIQIDNPSDILKYK